MTSKRKHKTLSLNEKADILDRLSRGESGRHLAAAYNIGTSTICDIKRNREKIERFLENHDSGPSVRKTLRRGKHPEMEKLLYSWFCKQQSKQITIPYETLARKAKQMYLKAYGRDDFEASRGWLANFRSRHGLRSLKIDDEKRSSDHRTAMDPFVLSLRRRIASLNLTTSQIYKADESALFWKLLPAKTVVHAEEGTTLDGTISREKVTLLACSNADGSHKLNLLVIGKCKSSRTFKKIELPVEYNNSKNAAMTFGILRQWFSESFIPQVRHYLNSQNLPEKALLLIDNATCYGSEEELVGEDGAFTIVFVPSNCTALAQPLHQNAIDMTTLFYRKSLLAHILSGGDVDFRTCLKSLNLNNAICFLSEAWSKVTSNMLRKCWHKILFAATRDNSDYDSISMTDIQQTTLAVSKEINTISEMLNGLTENSLRQNEIEEWIYNDNTFLPLEEPELVDPDTITNDIEDDGNCNETTVQHEEAVKCFNICLKWAEQNNVALNDLSSLKRLREIAFLEYRSKNSMDSE